MRQVLFVIAVVGAAFVGGAVVNGPGFRWAQERLLVYMGLQDGGEIASIDLPPAPGEAPVANVANVATAEGPATEPLVKEPEVRTAPTLDPNARRAGHERQALSQGVPAPKAEPRATEPFAETDADAQEPAADGASGAPALLGALAGALKQAAPPPGAADGPTKAPEPEPEPGDAPAPLDPSVAPALLASPAPSDSAPASASAPKDDASSGASGDWAELRRSLGDQGVTRYSIEGEPGGRVVFVCLIPLAGKQAVSQRFEAEGDDEFQAARAALRRINLWRAAQAESAQ